jgi:isoamylase
MAPSLDGARVQADGSVELRVRSQHATRIGSQHATRIECSIYAAATGAAPVLRRVLDAGPAGGFTTRIAAADLTAAGIQGTVYYGYRAWGPNWLFDPAWTAGSAAGFAADCDGAGNRFNPNKLLVDPYALDVSHNPQTPAQPRSDLYLSGAMHRLIDTGPIAPKGIVISVPQAAVGAKPTWPLKDDIVYEVNLRGLTKNDPGVPVALQGTYAGAALRAPYLAQLGVTAVEFLPVHEFQNALNEEQSQQGRQKYWGYDTLNFLAPSRRYARDQTPGGPAREFAAMVKAYHDVGLKVFLDVVYNHHGEGDVDGATGTVGLIYSLRGLDNRSYYECLSGANPPAYQNDNGVGPNLNAANPLFRDLVMASLNYWSETLGVDGFRFDLAAVLGNANITGGYSFNGVDPSNVLNRAVAELPSRPAAGGAGVDLIAEPYTASGAGQEQGHFPVGWSEWNDRYRDTFRASQNKLGYVNVTPGTMAMRIAGSDDLFRARGRAPWNGVNYITCHDGMTLHDLHAFSDRQNALPFPKGPSPGGRSAQQEMCWDHGGDAVAQRQAVRTSLALLLLSAGTPMLEGGSEIVRTQWGNNNAFNLDTIANWIDWRGAVAQAKLMTFVTSLLAFRRAYSCLRPAAFYTGALQNRTGLKDIAWYRDDGAEVDQAYFGNAGNHFLAFRLDATGTGDPAGSVYVAYNAWTAPIPAVVPAPRPGRTWLVVADTGAAAEAWANMLADGTYVPLTNAQYTTDGRSVALLVER